MNAPNTDLTCCLAYAYMARHWQLHAVADGITSSARAWSHLDAAATRTRIRIILAPWFRRGELPRRRIVCAWRFRDCSHVVYLKRDEYPAAIEVLPPEGVVAGLMRDTLRAISTVLRGSGLPVYEALACSYLELHPTLPFLDPDTLLCALQAERRSIRLAAITSLKCSDRRPSR